MQQNNFFMTYKSSRYKKKTEKVKFSVRQYLEYGVMENSWEFRQFLEKLQPHTNNWHLEDFGQLL